jgi:jumonji domain-containing protein 2
MSYLHDGCSKTWYVVPPAFGQLFEELVEKLNKPEAQRCKAVLRHKYIYLDPRLLEQHGFPSIKVEQRANKFFLLFPYAYHKGYNKGYNIAEAINFATEK